MFLLMLVGYILSKKDILNEEGTKQISAILMLVATPAVIISSYQRAFESELAKGLLITFVVGVMAYIISIILGNILFKKNVAEYFRDKRMCLVFSNNGFMAIPLLQALLGSVGVFLGSAHIVLGNVFLWTYGIRTVGGEKYKINLKTALINPGALAMFFGLGLFISPVKLPDSIYQICNYLGALNTPLAMMTLGAFLAKTNLQDCFRDISLYRISVYKLIVIPTLFLLFLLFLPITKTVAATLIIGTAAPTGIIAPMFAQRFDTEYTYSTKVVALTTLLCIVTMPVFLIIIEYLWRG
jgi:predicted permease